MKSLARCFQSASLQFIANAQPAVLSPRAKALVMATALVLVSGVSVMPSAHAADYVWGNGGRSTTGQDGQATQEKTPVVSENSVNRWGEILGGVIGRVAGAAIGGNAATSAIGRTAQDAVTSMSEEAGRNIGRGAVAKAPRLMPAVERDYIDTVGLNAVFAHGQAAQLAVSGRRDAPQSQSVFLARDRSVREFDLAVRNSANRGFPVTQWAQVRAMLDRPVGTIPEAHLVSQAQLMSDRLYRPGGPGYRVPSSYATTTLQDMNINMQNRNQAAAVLDYSNN